MENMVKTHDADKRQAKDDTEKGIIELSDQYKQKLIVEYQRYVNVESCLVYYTHFTRFLFVILRRYDCLRQV